jgi:ABC-type amino acid transport substrate-binding protein
MLKNIKYLLVLFLFMVVFCPYASFTAGPASGKTLIVGTKDTPPFAMKSADGKWTGISIELWRQIAQDLNLSYEYREADIQGLIEGVKDGSLDAAVAAMTITPDREQVLDFTHPFHSTGLTIAIKSKTGNPWIAVLKGFISFAFLKVLATLAFVLLGVGVLAWWFERRKNPQHFGEGPARGIWSGFWWSAVTMTTVGYGDKAPVTFGGRVVALIWMFTAIIIISGFTASITSSLTVTQLESAIKGPADLPHVRVGTIPNTTSADYLQKSRISFKPYKSPGEGLTALREAKIDAFVYDAPIIRYLINREYKGNLEVLPKIFMRQDYGFALPAGSPLREAINRILLEKIQEETWQDTLSKYLGN